MLAWRDTVGRDIYRTIQQIIPTDSLRNSRRCCARALAGLLHQQPQSFRRQVVIFKNEISGGYTPGITECVGLLVDADALAYAQHRTTAWRAVLDWNNNRGETHQGD